MRLRIGLAGCGIHGMRYAQHLLDGDIPGARLTAISRRDTLAGTAFASQHGLTFLDSAEALATHADVDAVVIALPPDMHPRVARACLGAGRPVLVEKPMAPDLDQARELVELVDSSDTLMMVGQTLRFDAVVQALKHEIDSIGPLMSISINQRLEPSNRSWIDTPGAGGMFLNTGVHGFDLLRYLTGLEPVSISAHSRRGHTRHTEDQFMAVLELDPGGVQAVIENTRSSSSRSGRIELIGETGQLWGDHVHRNLQRVVGREVTDLGPIPVAHTVPLTLQRFVRCVTEGLPSPITARDGLATIELVAAAELSDRTGRRVTLDSIRAQHIPESVVIPRQGHTRVPVGSIFAIGRNYAAHAAEMKAPVTKEPMVFLKPSSAIVHDGAVVALPADAGEVHHEVELVIVIGSAGRAIPEEQALEHVQGYAVGLDLTLRDMQSQAKKQGAPWSMSKGFDGSAPLSEMASRDEVGDGSGLDISLHVNGEQRQAGNTSMMLHSVAALVSFVSQRITLRPGDLIFTGTPAGVGPLCPGDTVDACIDRVGSLQFSISAD
jgi:2-keto-4-pentenoate hydratase/2-oxohepta-3-ene-1,7-dioic acid hydratase in catechol pathway